MATKPVKFYTSAMAGASVLSGTAGALIPILDACLVNGFNTKTVTSASVTTNVLTVNATAHGFLVNQVVELSGANEADLNSEWTVATAATDSFTATATGISNVTGTGTMSVKAAPLGFSKSYSGTNLAAYKANAGVPFYLRVDDTGTTTARVVGYETMSDVNTGTEPFPTAAQVSGGAYWFKSEAANANARTWVLIGDAQMFYFLPLYNTTYWIAAQGFGEFSSEKSGDVYNSILFGANATTALTTALNWQLSSSSNAHASSLSWVARAYTGVSGSAAATACSFSTGGLYALSGAAGGLTYPSPITNGFTFGTIQVKESSAVRCLRLPGIQVSPQATMLNHLDVLTGLSEFPSRTILIVRAQSATNDGRLFFDITGPWR